MKYITTLLILSLNIFAFGADLKPIVLDETYQHDKWNTEPDDLIYNFRAYTVSFDSEDDNTSDGVGESLGIPEWVAYEIRAVSEPLGKAPKRPNKWFTDKELFNKGIAPSDDSYRFSKAYRTSHKGSDLLGYDRGHMCMKYIAWRMGADADWNTHTLLNSVPQRKELNRKIWLDLEKKTAEWADKYGKIWVICGPVFYDTPSKWLGEENEFKVAIPDAFFKIVVREIEDNKLKTLAFMYPQKPESGKWKKVNKKFDHTPYLVSIDDIEEITGIDFLTSLEDSYQKGIEALKTFEL